MKQLASAIVNCAISEENNGIIKRALEAGFEGAQWKGNVLESSLGMYKTRVIIDVLPDSKGYLIVAGIDINTGCFWGLIIIFSVLFSVIGALSYKDKPESQIENIIIFFLFFVCLFVGLYLVDRSNAKQKTKKQFKSISHIFN